MAQGHTERPEISHAAPASRTPSQAGRYREEGKVFNTPERWLERFADVRQQTLDLCAPLELDDLGVQPMPDASPPKWHLAHTTWFFETFVLKPHLPGYLVYHPAFEQLFNSYYNGIGSPFPRAKRGNLSRPTIDDVLAYRSHVEAAIDLLFDEHASPKVIDTIELGLHHEQQHQELIVTDLKCVLGGNPLLPPYRSSVGSEASANCEPLVFVEMPGGIVEIGHEGDGFAFDNERPCHQALLRPHRLASRLVTNREYREFIEDDGYRRPELWLSDGWSNVQAGQIGPAPLYWRQDGDEWREYRLDGIGALRDHEPVVHVSYYEADAYARWRGARLPTEVEWEAAAARVGHDGIEGGNFVESRRFHPRAASGNAQLDQLFGDAWEWTTSSYAPYPGFRPLRGALGEYNGKFMCNQLVLRGGSCATPREHIRATYRNFFYPVDRWQFSGIRLAEDV